MQSHNISFGGMWPEAKGLGKVDVWVKIGSN